MPEVSAIGEGIIKAGMTMRRMAARGMAIKGMTAIGMVALMPFPGGCHPGGIHAAHKDAATPLLTRPRIITGDEIITASIPATGIRAGHGIFHADDGIGADRNGFIVAENIAALAALYPPGSLGGGGQTPPGPMPPPSIPPALPDIFTFDYALTLTCSSSRGACAAAPILTGTAVLEVNIDSGTLSLRDMDLRSMDADFHLSGMFSAHLMAAAENAPTIHESGNLMASLTRRTGMADFTLAPEATIDFGGYRPDPFAVTPGQIEIRMQTPDNTLFLTGTGEAAP